METKTQKHPGIETQDLYVKATYEFHPVGGGPVMKSIVVFADCVEEANEAYVRYRDELREKPDVRISRDLMDVRRFR